MCFRLVSDDSEFQLALPFEEHIGVRLCQVIGETDPPQSADRKRKDLARKIVELVTALVEGAMLPPSEKQLKYALAIARELALDLPPDALQYRQSMQVFLSVYADRYKSQKAGKRVAANRRERHLTQG